MSQTPPPPPPQEPYAAQPHERPEGGSKALAITALVLGVLALLAAITVIGGILLGLAAVIVGLVAALGRRPGRGLAIAGVVLGVLGLVISGALIALGAAFLNLGEVQDLGACLEEAGQDEAAVAACEQQFEDQLEDRLGS